MRKKYSTILLLLCFLLSTMPAYGEGQDKIIRGFAKFMIDRSQALMLENYLKKGEDNEYLGKFFRNTLEYLKSTHFLTWSIGNGLRTSLVKDLNSVLSTLKTYLKEKKYSTKTLSLIENVIATLSQVGFVQPKSEEKKNDIKSILVSIRDELLKREKASYVLVISDLFKLLDMTILKEEDSSIVNKFKKYAIFFAQLIDSKDSDEVAAILKSVTLSMNSFIQKREDRLSVFISSYLGLTAGIETQDNNPSDKKYHFYYDIFAPIGVDINSGGYNGWSFSLFFSIADLGNVVSAEMNEVDEKFTFKKVLSPGLYLIFGIPKTPISFGFGGQYGLNSTDGSNREVKASVFIAFDMPLFNLY